MALNRRGFMKMAGAGLAACAGVGAGKAAASGGFHPPENPLGVLIDTTKCIGCRKCEWACNQTNNLPVQPLETFEDKSVMQVARRPDAGHYTVVNQYPGPDPSGKPLWVKAQCMHCNDPACRSACVVTAFEKDPEGPVKYDAWRCMGCRYCMVACPFQIPAYEYDDPLTPEVRKCTFCLHRLEQEGGVPACVEICPPQCLIFGRRSQLLELAHRRIAAHPGEYVNHVYGEKEVGGTSWLYLSSRPFTEIGFPALGEESPPRITEKIQHGIFKDWIAPVALYAFLGGVMRHFRPEVPSGRSEGGRS